MTLKVKASFCIALVLALSGAMVYLIFNQVILEQFRELEDIQAHRNSARIVEAFQAESRTTEALARDWSMWDDAYSFVKDGSASFVEQNLSPSALSFSNIDHLVFLDRELKVLFAESSDRVSDKRSPLAPTSLESLITSEVPNRALQQFVPSGGKESVTGVGGYIRLNGKDYILVASPITNSEGTAPPVGVLCMLREMSSQMTTRFEEQTKLKIVVDQLNILNAENRAPRFTPFEDAFSPPSFSASADLLFGKLEVSDIFGDSLFAINLTMPREVASKGKAVEKFLMLAFLGVASITALIVIRLMQWMIVSPVTALGERLVEISKSEDFSARVSVKSSDELGILGDHINQTLAALQHAITRSEHAQHQAELANAAKTSFIAKVSHELRTPIHSITGMLRILLKEERTGAKRNYIIMAKNAAYGLLETINEILDFSKAEAGKLSLERIEFSLHEAIREALQAVGPRVEEKGSLETVVEVQQGIPDKLYGDPLRLRQVMVNLLGNAAKFTKQGHIGLRAAILERAEQGVLIQITVFDTGVGIPANRLDHIFEPFGQADDSVSRMFTGTGLGLTIVRQFVEAMGGAVSVDSEPGVGSQFILTIPFDVAADAVPLVWNASLRSSQVALVDGSSIAVKRFSEELARNGYSPDIFSFQDENSLDRLAQSINQYGLVIVTSEALKRSRIFDLVVALRSNTAVQVVAILSPFEISARERLVALKVPFVVMRPISLFDILGVVGGHLSIANEGWEDSEELSLNSARPLEVLVADDAQTNRIILTELLRDAGHHVVCVENGIDMVAKVKESLTGGSMAPQFDIILTDVQMPLLDGLNATAQIRSLEKELGAKSRLPIVAVTAHAMTDETSRMRLFGVDDVVTKPLDPLRLGQVIQRLTGQQASEKMPTPAPSGPQVAATPVTEIQLTEMGLRIWRSLAKRDKSLAELFGLSDDPLSPEDFQRVLDIVDVIERAGDSVRRTLLIFQGFLDCFGEYVQKLNRAKRSHNVDEIRFASHALKGLLLDVGARASGALASSIEQLSKGGEVEQVSPLIGQLTQQVLLVSRLVSHIHETASGKQLAGSTSPSLPFCDWDALKGQD
jgi:signal transduction histidine kinase/CheY-like chemotaxis protein/HPt (histidine-containing phosphotransfer) domain-containing protein